MVSLTDKERDVLRVLGTTPALVACSVVACRCTEAINAVGVRMVMRNLERKGLFVYADFQCARGEGENGLTWAGLVAANQLIGRPAPARCEPVPGHTPAELLAEMANIGTTRSTPEPEPEPPADPAPRKEKVMADQWVEGVSNVNLGCGIALALALLVGGVGACASIEYVNPGEVGVRTSWAQLDEATYTNDWYLVYPWQDMHQVNVQERSLVYSEPVSSPNAAVSYDTQTVGFSLQVAWQINPTQVRDLYLNYRAVGDANSIPETWGQAIVQPVLSQGLKSVIAKNTLRTIFRERDRVRGEVEVEIAKLLDEKLISRNKALKGAIRIVQVILTSLDYSDEFEKAIEATQLAEQRVLEQRNQLTMRQVQEAQKVVEAEAQQQADVARAQGAALSKLIDFEVELTRLANFVRLGVNPNLMYQWDRMSEFARKWNGELPKFMNGGEGMMGFTLPADVAAGDREFREQDLTLMLSEAHDRRLQLERQIIESRQALQDARERLLQDTGGQGNTPPGNQPVDPEHKDD